MESIKQKIGELFWWGYRRFQLLRRRRSLLGNIVMPILHLDAQYYWEGVMMNFKYFLLPLICFFSFQLAAYNTESIDDTQCTSCQFKFPTAYMFRHKDDSSTVKEHVDYFFPVFSKCALLSKFMIKQARMSSEYRENISKQLYLQFKQVITLHAGRNPYFPYELLDFIVKGIVKKYINLYVWSSLSE